jgi:hypothetical protein
MLGQKLQGANQRTNAGMQNIFGGLSTVASGITLGGGKKKKGGFYNSQFGSLYQ